ncbi:sugar ABC transporter permease [Dictyobacter alpinus]|uniref:Sugar ABC transporter permease n=1 Tax=Dictyobacter alpinus TaxID=2014873 RepID=A0A402BDF5_9CHLR|nr:carbohydrate ABC transporter permease [Dictyobacter alpinus]GCE29346.1 sugar ABC transporter permease [Dictyobacter alpinus]
MSTLLTRQQGKQAETNFARQRPKKSRRPLTWSTLREANLVTHAILLVGGFFWVYPFLWALGTSLKSVQEFTSSGLSLWPQQPQWANYLNAWNDASFGQYFVNTVFTTIFTVVFVVMFTSMAGYVLARVRFVGKKIIFGIIALTLFLPHGYTIVPIFDIVQRLGLLDTLWSIILVQVAGGMVFNTLLFSGYFTTIGKDMEEAARIDGASFHQIFWRVMFPLAAPMMATVALMTFIAAWNSYFIPLVFTLGNPELRTLPVGLYTFSAEHATSWTLLCAGSVMSLLPIIIIFVFLQRYFIQAVAGAIKG